MIRLSCGGTHWLTLIPSSSSKLLKFAQIVRRLLWLFPSSFHLPIRMMGDISTLPQFTANEAALFDGGVRPEQPTGTVGERLWRSGKIYIEYEPHSKVCHMNTRTDRIWSFVCSCLNWGCMSIQMIWGNWERLEESHDWVTRRNDLNLNYRHEAGERER